jgi:hypothetical protein
LWLVAAGAPARGAVIITGPSGGAHIIAGHSPIGQTFVAEDPHVTVGLHIDENPSSSASRELTISMFDGRGVDGALLDSRVVDVPQSFSRGYLDQDYSHLTLTVGQAYSVVLSSTSTAFYSDSSRTRYANGDPIINGVVSGELDDKAFRVVPVPEPAAALAVAAAALAAGTLGRAGRRRL